MIVLCHRGLWRKEIEQNREASLVRALDAGMGIEFDLRDGRGEVVISHDPVSGSVLPLEKFVQLYVRRQSRAVLALNIKSDGLAQPLSTLIKKYSLKHYFVFDMSIPQCVQYAKLGIRYYARQSEIEKEPVLYGRADGVWVDCFYTDWMTKKIIEGHLSKGKKVCVVSPELHRRDPLKIWKRLAGVDKRRDNLMLCTDRPQKAKEFFNG